MSEADLSSSGPSIVWFRQDLRLADNPALCMAAEFGQPVLPVYILDDETLGSWSPGGAARWWLHGSLTALTKELKAAGLPLILRRGRAQRVIEDLVDEMGAGAVFWNRCYEPFAIERDKAIKAALRDRGCTVESGNASLLFEPWTVKNKSGGPFKVFTPFWKALLKHDEPPTPLAVPRQMSAAESVSSESLEDWGLLPSAPDWAGGLRAAWTPGEAEARTKVESFIETNLAGYEQGRDRPGLTATSRLSPHLHWGEISPRQVWHAVQYGVGGGTKPDGPALAYLRELGWREFSYHLLYHWPDLPERPWKREFENFAWVDDEPAFEAWSRGQTGYPIVDAGMRELWTTGWMHNRVRMIVASFLVKDLLVPWQRGAAWFWDTLVDADLANNSASWQWVAGCGADAAPFFRIFNPVLQGQKFDPDGAYVRTWLPEIGGLPDNLIHKPWEASAEALAEAGIKLDGSYPRPVVDHAQARQRALKFLSELKNTGTDEPAAVS